VVGELPPVVVPILAKPVTNPVSAVISKVTGNTAAPASKAVSKKVKAKARKIARRSVLVKGKVRTGKTRSAKVRIQVRRKAGRRWVAVRTATVTVNGNGRFAKLFTGLKKGRYTAKATAVGRSAPQAKVSARGFRIAR
jgi:hypothetical protein